MFSGATTAKTSDIWRTVCKEGFHSFSKVSSVRISDSQGRAQLCRSTCLIQQRVDRAFALQPLNPNWLIFQISWSKKNGLLDTGLKFHEGSIYTIHNISRHQAGIYKCQASNGVGYPVLEEIDLTVLCKQAFTDKRHILLRNVEIENLQVLSSKIKIKTVFLKLGYHISSFFLIFPVSLK